MNEVLSLTSVPQSSELPEQLHSVAACTRDIRDIVSRTLQIHPFLGKDEVPLQDLGADSLLLSQIASEIKRCMDIEVDMILISDSCNTVSALARYASDHFPHREVSPVGAGQDANLSRLNDLSPTFSLQPQPGSTANMPLSIAWLIRQQTELMSGQLALLTKAQSGGAIFTEPAAAHDPSGVQAHGDGGGHRPGQPAVKPIVLQSSMPADNPSAAVHGGDLSTKQRLHLEDLSRRYTGSTAKSRAYAEAARRFHADPRSASGFRQPTKDMIYPIIGDKGMGPHFWDVDGNRYIDLAMGFGALLFGHNPLFLRSAFQEAMASGVQLGPQSSLAHRVAENLQTLTKVERVAFCTTGTEAVMSALRLARLRRGRELVALFLNSYHGHSDVVLAARGGDGSAVPAYPGVSAGAAGSVVPLEYGSAESLETIRSRASELAAVLVEPVQGARPELVPADYLRQLRRLTLDCGIPLIFDEVVTGFRTSPGGVRSLLEVDADIVVYGKVLGGGLPIGVIAGTGGYLDAIDGGYWRYGDESRPAATRTFLSGTYNKNPLSMQAALAVTRQLLEAGPSLQADLNRKTDDLVGELNRTFASVGAPHRAVNFSSLFRIRNVDPFGLFYNHLVLRGVYVWENRSCFLSTSHSLADLDAIIAAAKASVEELLDAGFHAT